jgi:hypothetical protein
MAQNGELLMIARMQDCWKRSRLLRAIAKLLLIVACVASAAACAATSNFVADHWPRWASGEPEDIPPRSGAPEYEEFRKQLVAPKPIPSDERNPGDDQAAPR